MQRAYCRGSRLLTVHILYHFCYNEVMDLFLEIILKKLPDTEPDTPRLLNYLAESGFDNLYKYINDLYGEGTSL